MSTRKRERTAYLALRLTEAEKVCLRRAAEVAGTTMSAYVLLAVKEQRLRDRRDAAAPGSVISAGQTFTLPATGAITGVTVITR